MGDFADQDEDYLNEVKARWGNSEAYYQCSRCVARYGKAEWERINLDDAAIETRIRELMDAGVDPTSAEAMDVAEAQRARISRWFYEMDPTSTPRRATCTRTTRGFGPAPRTTPGREQSSGSRSQSRRTPHAVDIGAAQAAARPRLLWPA
ncbi:TipAS antibiotic-recognition domain-containing protein [Ornithinimicrobium murale]|uniref:TipAS antibiotic-recognition domain-containing protein n=1 Tax=Ornithinimicrobium murale TaxID=1050153 RepID=UPI000E0CF6B9